MTKPLIVIVLLACALLWAQSALTVSPSAGTGLLSACPAPAAKTMIICGVSGDSLNTNGAYVSIDGGAYAKTSTGGIMPQSFTAAAGQCITSYDATTGKFGTSPCVASLTKSAVLATGISASTTLQ